MEGRKKMVNREVKVFKTIDEIDKESMDLIADDGFFTHGWFKTLETSKILNVKVFYFAVYDENKVIAIAPCFIDSIDKYFSFIGKNPLISRIVNMSNRFRFSPSHILVCYSPDSCQTKILLEKGLDGKEISKLILRKIDDFCKKERISISLFFYVSESDKVLIKNLRNLGYLKFYLKENLNLDVNWSNFEGYLQSLTYDRRKDVKREIRKFRESGVTIAEECEYGYLSTKISILHENLYAKHNKGAKSPFTSYFFRKLNEYAKDKTRIFVAKKNDEIIGFVLFLKHAGILDAYICGFDYNVLTKTDFLYFNLVYYEPINLAIAEGIRRIHYRAGDYSTLKAKYRRGCKPEKFYSFVKVHDKFLEYLIRLAFRRKLTQ